MATNKVVINGKTLIDLTEDTVSEETVLKGYKFHKPNGVQGIGSYEEKSKINGLIQKYKVNEGKVVNSGDWLEFLYKLGIKDFSQNVVSYTNVCKLNDNQLFLTYIDNATKFINYKIINFENSEIVISEEKVLFNQEQCINFNIINLSTNKLFIVYTNTDNYSFCNVIEIGNNIIFGESFSINGINIVPLKLTENLIVLAGNIINSTSEAYNGNLRLLCLEINNSTIIEKSRYTVESGNNRISGIYISYMDTNVFSLSYDKYSSSQLQSYYAVSIYSIHNYEIIKIEGTIGKGAGGITVGLSPTIAMFERTPYSMGYYDDTELFTLSTDSNVSSVKNTLTDLGGVTNGLQIAKNYAIIIDVKSSTNTTNASLVKYNESNSLTRYKFVTIYDKRLKYVSLVKINENSIMLCGYDEANIKGVLRIINIEDTVLSVVDKDEIFVQPLTNKLNIGGIAKTSGTSGEEIEVYVPNL